MPPDGSATRTAILDAAEGLILDRGYAGASVDRIIERAGITKGTFFHHFDGKARLAQELIERWARIDAEHLESKLTRAERLSRDPLQQLLLFAGFFIEEADELTAPEAGCLFGAYCYQSGLFEAGTLQVAEEAMRLWRVRLRGKLDEVAELYPPRMEVDLESLADQITVVFEGAYVVGRTLDEPEVVANQVRHHRNYLELLFGSA